MSGFEKSRDTWNDLLRDLQPLLAGQETVPNQTRFQHAFIRSCRTGKEKNPERLVGRFDRHHDKVISFVGALDQSFGFDEPSSLGSLFWSLALSVFQAALRNNRKAVVFEDPLPSLNEAFPALGANLGLYPDDKRVQVPLQQIFREYIECYAIMLRQFATVPSSLRFQAFDDRIESTRTVFADSKQQWEQIVQKAQQEEKERLAASTVSVPRDSMGLLRPYAPRPAFEYLEVLGQGTYGYVSKVRQHNTGRMYAQKIIRVTDPRWRPTIQKEVENEVDIMQRLPHLHIAKLLFWDHDPEADLFTIVMLPVAEYNLLQFLQEKCINASFPRTELTHLTRWFGCLVSALAFAHASDIKHEDIKPGNILIKDHQPYLADFGSAKDFSDGGLSTSTSITGFGTPVYWAPEKPPRGRGADIFALGCVFSEMLTVRQGRTLDDYKQFRYNQHRDYGYAFRESLPRVYEWLEQLKHKADEPVTILVDQTLRMLDEDKNRRPLAGTVKRGLRIDIETFFCTVCSVA